MNEEELRALVAAEMARHRDVIEGLDHEGVPDGNGELFRYGCTCGHVRGTWTEREAIARIRENVEKQREHVADTLLPVVSRYADQRAAQEIERLADERSWVTQYDNEVVSARELYEQVARLRGELAPVTYDFPPDGTP